MHLKSLALLAFLGFALVLSCRIEPNSIKGNLPAADVAVQLNGGRIQLPTTNLFSGTGFTILVDVFTDMTDGCLFSAGKPGTNNYVDLRIKQSQVQLTIGDTTVSTFRVFTSSKWQKIAVTVSNVDSSVRVYINGEERPTSGKFPLDLIKAGERAGTFGFCTKDSFRFQGSLDNLVILSDIISASEVEWHNTQFVPFLVRLRSFLVLSLSR